MSGRHILLCISLSLLELPIEASHFRGGTISWKPTGNGNEVKNFIFVLKFEKKRFFFIRKSIYNS